LDGLNGTELAQWTLSFPVSGRLPPPLVSDDKIVIHVMPDEPGLTVSVPETEPLVMETGAPPAVGTAEQPEIVPASRAFSFLNEAVFPLSGGVKVREPFKWVQLSP
jgi:hypothetical protein